MKLLELKSIIMDCINELGVESDDYDGDFEARKNARSKSLRNDRRLKKQQDKYRNREVEKKIRLKNGMKKRLGEGIDEGTRRLDRLVNSKAHYSRSPEVRKKADRDFETSINKLRRRNKRYEERHGQIKLANARLQRGPVKEEKKYFTKPPIKGFNRTEPMAYKKKSLSGKIASGIRKFEKKVGK